MDAIVVEKQAGFIAGEDTVVMPANAASWFTNFVSLQLTPYLIPIILFVTSVKLWYVYTSAKDPNCHLPLPPGTMGLPIIGETLNLIMKGSDFFLERTASYGKIYKTHILGQRTIRVTGAKNVAKILQGEGTLVQCQWPPSTKLILGEGALIHSYGENHRWRRDVILKAFCPSALRTYMPSVQRIARDYVQKWVRRGSIHGYPEARSFTFTVAAKMLLGFDVEDMKKYQMLILFEDMLATLFSMPVPIPGIGLYRGMKARRRILQEIDDCIRHRQESNEDEKHEDALGMMLEAAENGKHRLSRQEMSDSALEMLFAGHLPTSSAACSILMFLGANPMIVDKITVELHEAGILQSKSDSDLTLEKVNSLTLVESVVREVLRLAPPVGGGYRKALQTFEIDGCQVPKGWTVIYSIRETQHTSELFRDALTFNPERWQTEMKGKPEADNSSAATEADSQLVPGPENEDFHYVPFGWGTRSCVGQKYAEVILKVLIIELVRNASWRLVNGLPDLRYVPVPHPVDQLPLQFKAMPPELRRRAFTMTW